MEAQADPLLVSEAVEGARFFVYAYNATTLVTTAGLALGLFFIITAIALYYYYYSASDTRRSGGHWQYDGQHRSSLPGLVEVLGLLEEAWALYGVEEGGCRRRLVCEALLPPPDAATTPMAATLRHLLSQVTNDLLDQANDESAASVRDLQMAGHYGRKARTCQPYVQHCPHLALSDLSTLRPALPTPGTL